MSRLQKYRSDMTKQIKVNVVSKPSLPSELQPSGPLASRQDPTAVNQNPGPCAAPKSLSTIINKPNTDFVTKEMAKKLKQVSENIGKFGAISSPRRLALAANTSQQEAQKFLEKQESHTLHRRSVKPKHFRKTIALYPFEIAQAALMSLDGSYAKHNAPYKFLLVIIDIFLRKLFVKPLTSKHGSEVAKQLEQVFSEQTFKKIHIDTGKQFLIPSVKKTLEKYQIELYHTHSHLKATIVERSIRTLCSHLSAFCTHFNTFSFVTRLDLTVSQYNNSPHRSLGNLAPNQVILQNTPYIADFMYGKN
ncbi:hypothetical protein QYM36_003117 [Artemia franciscana]|uniref:Integrase catalytic domain-containing protein n=1 Tax=Artemia franciscana TaxID=6661 RepID=A0AA88I7M5_ARTSF|nr:hypothetical protein QYM36_003117 [Artemia franciscana]